MLADSPNGLVGSCPPATAVGASRSSWRCPCWWWTPATRPGAPSWTPCGSPPPVPALPRPSRRLDGSNSQSIESCSFSLDVSIGTIQLQYEPSKIIQLINFRKYSRN